MKSLKSVTCNHNTSRMVDEKTVQYMALFWILTTPSVYTASSRQKLRIYLRKGSYGRVHILQTISPHLFLRFASMCHAQKKKKVLDGRHLKDETTRKAKKCLSSSPSSLGSSLFAVRLAFVVVRCRLCRCSSLLFVFVRRRRHRRPLRCCRLFVVVYVASVVVVSLRSLLTICIFVCS